MTTSAEQNSQETSPTTDSGVDRTLLQWMASKTPEERLQSLQNNVDAIIHAKNARQPSKKSDQYMLEILREMQNLES